SASDAQAVRAEPLAAPCSAARRCRAGLPDDKLVGSSRRRRRECRRWCSFARCLRLPVVSKAGPRLSGAQMDAASDEPGISRALTALRSLLIPGEELETHAIQRRLFALTHRRTI